MSLPALVLKQSDFQQIASLIRSHDSETAQLLEEELNRALIVEDGELSGDVVVMNSKVTFADIDSGKESTVALVYPNDASIEKNSVSILAPIGAALIGLRIGQTIEWPLPNGKSKTLKVLSVSRPIEMVGV